MYPVIGGLLFWEKKKNLIKAVCVWLMLTILGMDKLVLILSYYLELEEYKIK